MKLPCDQRSALLPFPIILFVALLCLANAGCAGLGDYCLDRVLDLTDIVDLKYGFAIGAGAKVEVTDYAGAGLGLGFGFIVTEWYGRKVCWDHTHFVHLGIVGLDGTSVNERNYVGCISLYSVHLIERYPLITRFRIGAEAFIPGPYLGAYLNLGELADFLLGFTTFDLADDDHIPLEFDIYQGSTKKIKSGYHRNQDDRRRCHETYKLLDVAKETIARDTLIRILHTDPDPKVRISAAQGLRYNGDEESIAALLLALAYNEGEVKGFIAYELCNLDVKEAMVPLIEAIRTANFNLGIRLRMIGTLERMTGQDFNGDRDRCLEWWELNKADYLIDSGD